MRAGGAEHDRVAVGLCIEYQSRAQRAAGPGTVIDDDLLAQHFAEFRRQHACKQIGAAARRERHDHAHGARRVGLGVCHGGAEQRGRQSGDGNHAAKT